MVWVESSESQTILAVKWEAGPDAREKEEVDVREEVELLRLRGRVAKTPAEMGAGSINKRCPCCKRASGAEPGLIDKQSPTQHPR